MLFPELALTGYPPEDLLLKEHFLADSRTALDGLAVEAEGIAAVVGFPERAEDVFNAAAVLAEGGVHAIYRKVYLPNYGVSTSSATSKRAAREPSLTSARNASGSQSARTCGSRAPRPARRATRAPR